MKQISITIETTTNAFHNDPRSEVARILKELALRVMEGEYGDESDDIGGINLFDLDGNTIGQVTTK